MSKQQRMRSAGCSHHPLYLLSHVSRLHVTHTHHHMHASTRTHPDGIDAWTFVVGCLGGSAVGQLHALVEL